MKNNNNVQEVIVKVSFRKGSNEIYAGLTANNNVSLVGEIVYSTDLDVSYYNSIVVLNSENAVGKVGTICIPDENIAIAVINQLNTIQTKRPINARGNKYPFCFLRVLVEGDVIYNKGLNGDPDRLSILDVEIIEVHDQAPDEVINLNKVKNVSTSVNQPVRKTRSFYQYLQTKTEMKAAAHFVHRSATPSGRRAAEEAAPQPIKPNTSKVDVLENLSQEERDDLLRELLEKQSKVESVF